MDELVQDEDSRVAMFVGHCVGRRFKQLEKAMPDVPASVVAALAGRDVFLVLDTSADPIQALQDMDSVDEI